MPRAKKPKAEASDDPNALKRVRAGAYRSADERFEVAEGGTGWFVVDTTQADELGQQIVQGPYPTLAAVRDALPGARRTTVRPLPRPRHRAAPEPEPEPMQPLAEVEPEPEPMHPLAAILANAAAGTFPPADGGVTVLASPPGRADAVVAFTSHAVVAGDVTEAAIRRRLPADDPAAPMSVPFLAWLGKQLGAEPGDVDVVLAAHPGWASPKALKLAELEGTAAEHERIARAHAYRTEVRAFTDPDQRGLVMVGRGLADRLEVSIEVFIDHRGRGLGADLARAALTLVDSGEPLFAQVTPGNVASLRAFLAAGYRPIGAEVLFLRKKA
jgi:hypothetical protein